MSEYRYRDGLTTQELLSIIDRLPKNMACFKSLGHLQEKDRTLYEEAYSHFMNVNAKKNLNGNSQEDDNRIKGKALEDLVSSLFELTGGYYEVYKNVRNGSNEIDVFLSLSSKGRCVAPLINKRYEKLICECKNYKSTISVTYVGKFYSLMQTTNNKVGIMFSYNGFTGASWGGAKGLTKKLFLLREREEDRLYILEFTYKDFKDILDGKGLFDILESKCLELELGLDDITKYITTHPNEDKT